ncbi:MAG: hypothetical protein DMF77_19210 [Acidobacteria bacterium]|nr:MAG: hypothetical protein DMF77_19210 [Acidobacteriota bacterium]
MKQAFIFGYLPTTMQPTALWSISRPWDMAMAGVSVVRINPIQINRPVMRALLTPEPAFTERPARSGAAGLPNENLSAHITARPAGCQ